MEENELVVVADTDFQEANLPAVFSPATVLKYYNFVKDVQREVMKPNIHYGTIPGTPKPTLYQPGAEALCSAFRLAATFEWNISEMENGHREYIARCRLNHIDSCTFVGEGVGSCSTMEKKYRWRKKDPIVTDKPVPKSYWDNRDSAVLGGKNFIPKKVGSTYYIAEDNPGTTENTDIADCYNTCLKMACKRAYVMATLKVTGASDIFTQDVEDMPKSFTSNGSNTTQKPKSTAQETAASEPIIDYGMCPECGKHTLELQTVKKGTKVGKQFLACPGWKKATCDYKDWQWPKKETSDESAEASDKNKAELRVGGAPKENQNPERKAAAEHLKVLMNELFDRKDDGALWLLNYGTTGTIVGLDDDGLSLAVKAASALLDKKADEEAENA